MFTRLVPDGDSALTVEFDDRIDPSVNSLVVALAEAVAAARIDGVRDVVPTFRSVTIYFDPLKTATDRMIEWLELEAGRIGARPPAPLRLIRIPVCYGGDYGPDLMEIAAEVHLDAHEVVERHARVTYQVFMLGFTPGFAYMASVDPRIAVSRRATPRVRVSAGSVGIAGIQTGVYPSNSPGGWRLVGRTPVKPFDRTRQEPFLFKPGDAVQFYPIEPDEYERALQALKEGDR